MEKIIGIIVMISLFGCATHKIYSSLSIDSSAFEIPPTVIKSNGKYYLQYQFKMIDSVNIENRHFLESTIRERKGYFFMVGPISFRQHYNIIGIEIKGDLLERLSKDSLYWLNPDGSEVKLKVNK